MALRNEKLSKIREGLFATDEPKAPQPETSGFPSQPTVRCTAHRWLSECDGIKNTTRQRYEYILERFAAFTGKTPFRPRPYASNSRLAPSGYNKPKATWVRNTTRGTNDFKHCAHAIYLYSQNLNPNILKWFGGLQAISNDDYALTELIKRLWRPRIRDEKPAFSLAP